MTTWPETLNSEPAMGRADHHATTRGDHHMPDSGRYVSKTRRPSDLRADRQQARKQARGIRLWVPVGIMAGAAQAAALSATGMTGVPVSAHHAATPAPAQPTQGQVQIVYSDRPHTATPTTTTQPAAATTSARRAAATTPTRPRPTRAASTPRPVPPPPTTVVRADQGDQNNQGNSPAAPAAPAATLNIVSEAANVVLAPIRALLGR